MERQVLLVNSKAVRMFQRRAGSLLNVIENIIIAPVMLLGLSKQEAYDRAMELLHSVGMEKLALRYPEYLSGGQKQRAAIARTLSTDPEFVLFDEPTSSLDPLGVTEVENVISRLASEGRTMMIVTHSMELARRASNRVMFLSGGEIYEEGTPEQIFGSPQREKTRKFVRRLLSLEMTVEEVAHDLNEQIGRVYAFCADRGVDAKRIVNACASYEEGYCLMLRYVVGTDKTVNVSVEYDVSEDRLSMAFTPNSVLM